MRSKAPTHEDAEMVDSRSSSLCCLPSRLRQLRPSPARASPCRRADYPGRGIYHTSWQHMAHMVSSHRPRCFASQSHPHAGRLEGARRADRPCRLSKSKRRPCGDHQQTKALRKSMPVAAKTPPSPSSRRSCSSCFYLAATEQRHLQSMGRSPCCFVPGERGVGPGESRTTDSRTVARISRDRSSHQAVAVPSGQPRGHRLPPALAVSRLDDLQE